MVAMSFPKTVHHDAFTTFVPVWCVFAVIARAVERGYRESDIQIWKCDSEGDPEIREVKKIATKIRDMYGGVH